QPKNRAAAPDPVDAAVKAKANELQGMLKPVSLKSPINGMVSMIHHLKGERILRGTPIVTITDPETRRIVGYVRQPVSEMPTTNDFVQIITRSLPRQLARGSIVRVGAQMEPINPALLSADTKRMEVGLPILVSVPPGVRLVPGEYVNLYIDKR
ncbi:MAG TPA: HlyD family efflux transporter periplasmic adaptor subunit, partial [Candidatus Saccharimonadales bacterium]|nr:HlyD family efflux transporter periplasmic adaptor subunit [Candidatus Saccharimonadales bacterium]